MRTSKIEKEINQIIIDNNEVQDSVLNEVKNEMLKDKLHKTSTFRLFLPIKCIRMMKVAMIIVFIVLLPITSVGTYYIVNYGWYNQDTANYNDLIKTKIESIEWYNQVKNTNYLWIEDLPVIDSYSLSNQKNKIVMLEEQYQYKNHLVTLYIHKEIVNINLDVHFYQRGEVNINDINISCKYYKSMGTILTFSYLDANYDLKFDYEVTNVEDTLIELFKNQSIFD